MNTVSAKQTPYTHHHEREERYHEELRAIEKRGDSHKDMEESKIQALENACSSEFIDATMKLLGQRVRVTQKGRALGTEYTVIQIIRLCPTHSTERACFAIEYWGALGKKEILPIYPSTKIFILEEEAYTTDASARHFF